MASSGGFIADFKKFLMQGNVVDLAVAVIIGGAFGKIIESLVKDIVTPGILNPVLEAAKLKDIKELKFAGMSYGNFLAEIINFVIVALSIFIIIRLLESTKKRFSRQQAIAEAEAPSAESLLQERMANTLDRLADALDRR
jgi:large conductance mechanosensitive channel